MKAEEPEPSDGVMVRYVTDDEAAFEWSSAERRDDGECPGLAVLSKRTYFRSAALATLLCPFTFVDSIHYLRVHLKVRGDFWCMRIKSLGLQKRSCLPRANYSNFVVITRVSVLRELFSWSLLGSIRFLKSCLLFGHII